MGLLLVPVAFWFWLCRDWPSRLGFFCDDWVILLHPFVGSAAAFHDIASLVVTRPVSAPFIWLAQLIVDWSPERSQMLNAVMLLVTATGVGVLAAALTSSIRGLRGGLLAAACIATAAFIVFPSTVGTFAWGVGVTTAVPALPLFCLGMSLLLRAEGSWWRLALGLALTALSHLSYEAFYFQEIAFALIAANLRASNIRQLPWRVLMGASLVNVGCLAFNRLSTGGLQKTFHWDFLQIFVTGYTHIVPILDHATREHDNLIGPSLIVAGLAGALCLARLVGLGRVALTLVLMICGIVAAGFLYAFAGYGLAAEGPSARVCVVLATYCAIASGVLAAAAWDSVGWARLPGVVFWLFLATELTGLGLTARARVGDWAETWSYELARLSRLPAAVASVAAPAANEQHIYLAVDDKLALAVAPAMAPWEITGAVGWATYRLTKSQEWLVAYWSGKTSWYATPTDWFDRWDGHALEQGPCASGTAAYSVSSAELWVWKTSTAELTRVDAPWQYGCH